MALYEVIDGFKQILVGFDQVIDEFKQVLIGSEQVFFDRPEHQKPSKLSLKP